MYTYKAKLIRVIDGDTADFTVDLGFRTFMQLRFRLYGIDTPERGQKGWAEATEHLKYLIGEATNLVLHTHKDPDAFGRYLCTVYNLDTNVNAAMIEDGHAVEYKRS